MKSGTEQKWPVVSMEETFKKLTKPEMPFEMEAINLRGIELRAYKSALNDLREVFDIGRSWGDREYIVYEGERQTYEDHFKAASVLGCILMESYGVKKGDRIVIAMRNLPEWSLAFWAGASIGAIVVPLNAWGLGPDLAYGIEDSGAKVAFVDGTRLDLLQPHLNELDLAGIIAARATSGQCQGVIRLEDLIGVPEDYKALRDDVPPNPGSHTDDDATILYTSGTTGKPKGAIGSHRNIMSNFVSLQFNACRSLIRRGDPLPLPVLDAPQRVNLVPVPLFHVTGTNSMMIPSVATGAKIVLMHKWNPEKFLELIEEEQVNSTTGVPAMVWQVLESLDFKLRDLSSLDSYGYGGAAVAPELTLRFAEAFPNFPPGQGYGATETSSVSVVNSAEDYIARPDSVGVAVPVVDIKVISDDGVELPANEIGELWIKGPNIVRGYWNNPEATAESFTDGWYHSGDIARVDEEGFVYILDRSKDMLIRGGENIYCVEIEDILVSHPDVIDAAVIGLPHRVWGEEVGAVVQLKPGAEMDEQDLIAFAEKFLPKFKLPVYVDVRKMEFPRNASGKTLKPVLREEVLQKRDVE